MAYTETRFLTGRRALVPDLSYYRAERIEGPDSQGRVPEDFTVPPDVAIEIKSPGQTVTAQLEKCARYQALGVPISLFVHPEERAVFELRPGLPLRVLQGDDHLDFGDVIPGLDLSMSAMFDSVIAPWVSQRSAQATAPEDPVSEGSN